MEHEPVHNDAQSENHSSFDKWQATLKGSIPRPNSSSAPNPEPNNLASELNSNSESSDLAPGPDQIIIDGPSANFPEDMPKEEFQQLFFKAMKQGVATDDDGQPHFFRPRTFLQSTGRKIYRAHAEFKPFAHGLSDIVKTKNLPENQENPSVQEAARTAIYEYLDPNLFEGNGYIHSELVEIYSHLDREVMQDPMLNRCLIDADNYREEIIERRKEAVFNRTESEYLEQQAREHQGRNRQTRPLLQFSPNMSVTEVRNLLQDSPNRVAFERINALEAWRDFIEQNIPDANLTEGVRNFQPESRSPKHRKYPDSDTYSVIAFNYAGHRCMIAESCNEQSSAAMKVWRGELSSPNGWEQAFTKTKKEAARYNLCKDIRHTNLASDVESRDPSDYQYIMESENKLFKIAFHYFETGELFSNNKDASTKLDELIGPQMRRPNSLEN